MLILSKWKYFKVLISLVKFVCLEKQIPGLFTEPTAHSFTQVKKQNNHL